MAQEFIEFFTKRGQTVLDPMAGTGSTLEAALRSGRHSYGIELNTTYAQIACQVLDSVRTELGEAAQGITAEVLTGDAARAVELLADHHLPPVDYVLTSPPYWDMLHAPGAETQRKRRSSAELDLVYSSHPDDLGNISDYQEFLHRLVTIYQGLHPLLRPGAYLTIIVKNVKKGGKLYPLAWDLARQLDGVYTLKDERIWCQDNQRLAPYGLGNAWVSNTFHHYCLQFRN
jgi:DNA modification methylase